MEPLTKPVSCPVRVSLGVFVLSLGLATTLGALRQKELIEFGWDEPSTVFLRTHITEMEQMPFDGCVFHVDHKLPGGEQIRLTWECWGKRAFTTAELQPALEDLRATHFRRFRHNFLRFNATPGDVDWFDDFSAVLNNARLAARLAKAGHAAGILFDIEAYNAPLWDYRKQRLASTRSWTEYQAQARQRGREAMENFQAGYPGITVFLTFGYSIAWAQMGNGHRPLADCQYGLLPAFLDGLIGAARGRTRVVEGCELAYGYKDPQRFEKEYQTMKTDLLPIVADPKKYHAAMSLGFGLWLDNNSHKHPWNTDDFAKNYYTPDQFEASLTRALQVSDQYVWVYSETPRWWSDAGPPANLPQPYLDAVRRARSAVIKH